MNLKRERVQAETSTYRYTNVDSGDRFLVTFVYEGKKELGWMWEQEDSVGVKSDVPLPNLKAVVDDIMSRSGRRENAKVAKPLAVSDEVLQPSIRHVLDDFNQHALLITVVGVAKPTKSKSKRAPLSPGATTSRTYVIRETQFDQRVEESVLLCAILDDPRYEWRCR